ncbi:DEAD/DEAH box helicase [Stieleria sp. JC731]|uniref:DEAD/DEAH box helicase n=1 Tax=Pirellulaceae TaxID=2691357 RepID=UPI001E4092A2|nr:DEAD/DEAH box helicase [Stieleria sp. JC731]MCC9603533.1 DEAD/DEAH box helicase [Stieleria sp. JC731]
MSHYVLRPYQQYAVDATWGYLCHRQGHPVVIAPTGAGKSLMIADICKSAHEAGLRVLVVAHVKELLEQNSEKIRTLVPDADVTIYSAGLGQKDLTGDIVVAGVQSVYKHGFDLGKIDLVLVDEAHMIPATGDGMYRQLFDDLSKTSPNHRVIGFTATPYRMTTGLIYGPDELFDGVAYNIQIGQLIKEGYLCPITSEPVQSVKTSDLPIRRGEFVASDMQLRFDEHTASTCDDLIANCDRSGRKHVIIFASGVEHAQHISDYIEEKTGEIVHTITGDTKPIFRKSSIRAFREGEIRWLVNVGVLTTGFDAPCVDCVALLRATDSPGLLAQMIGRGLRLHPEKSECLVLDYGENLERHGPIDSKDFGVRRGKKGEATMGNAPVKECPQCTEMVPAGLRECFCGFQFPPPESNTKHEAQADTNAAVLEEQIKPERWEVTEIRWAVHRKRGASDDEPRSLRVDYCCQPEDAESAGNLTEKWISEWICLEHEGFAGKKARDWWRQRSKADPPETIEEAIERFDEGFVADTQAITTIKDGRYQRVTQWVIGEVPDEPQFEVSNSLFSDPFDEEAPPF